MLCIWYLFLCMASLSIFESNAILIDGSNFTVITTGLMKCSSEHFLSLLICFSFMSFFSSFFTFSVRCNGMRLPLCCVERNFFKMLISLRGLMICPILYRGGGVW